MLNCFKIMYIKSMLIFFFNHLISLFFLISKKKINKFTSFFSSSLFKLSFEIDDGLNQDITNFMLLTERTIKCLPCLIKDIIKTK